MQHFKRAGIKLDSSRDYKSSKDHASGKRKFNSAVKLKGVHAYDSSWKLTLRVLPACLHDKMPVCLTR